MIDQLPLLAILQQGYCEYFASRDEQNPGDNAQVHLRQRKRELKTISYSLNSTADCICLLHVHVESSPSAASGRVSFGSGQGFPSPRKDPFLLRGVDRITEEVIMHV